MYELSANKVPRRTLAKAAFVTVAALAVPATRRTFAQDDGVQQSGDCSREPGVQLLLDWRSGDAVFSSAELLPGADWAVFAHPASAIALVIPPGWKAEMLFATDFTRTGEPRWSRRQPQLPQLSLLRITSPDGDAVFEYGLGSIQGPALTTSVVAQVATQGTLGADPEIRPICAYDDPANPVSPSWFQASRVDRAVLVSSGNALGLLDAYAPATIVSYFDMLGPRRDYEELMGSVFIPLLYQFSGGGGSDDEDDDDGEEEDGSDDDA